MPMFSSFHISASALTAERLRMDVISGNIANAHTTRAANGQPYQRERVVFQPMTNAATGATGAGVMVTTLSPDPRPGQTVHEPSNPDANAQGDVTYPNVDVATEMVDMISATRAYEANVVAMNAAKQMTAKALEIGQA
jgi:flagellar basal-body rod protein FlgC